MGQCRSSSEYLSRSRCLVQPVRRKIAAKVIEIGRTCVRDFIMKGFRMIKIVYKLQSRHDENTLSMPGPLRIDPSLPYTRCIKKEHPRPAHPNQPPDYQQKRKPASSWQRQPRQL